MKRFYIHKLGCPKNDVDAEYIAGFLCHQNLAAVNNPEDADLLIVNSCGFIQPAKEESINAVLSLARLKKSNAGKKLIITGCLSQRYAEELAADIPELDGVFGLNDFRDMQRLLNGETARILSRRNNPDSYPGFDFPRAFTPGESFAYVKISDGCDNRCSYCAIPNIRGHYRSRPIEAVCKESADALTEGKRELILVSQESTAYGQDIYGSPRLIDLLTHLSKFEGNYWIRIMYMHPARLHEELIDYIIDNRRICNYFDLPLQHINDRLLQAMGRKVTRGHIEKLLKRIRSAKERTAIRTSFIVGFPGETDEEFDELYQFIEKQRFERLGAFPFSAEEGTPAALLPGQLAEEIRENRYNKLMELQQQIAFENNDSEIGHRLEVIVDTVQAGENTAIGRTRFDAPEIDQSVRFSDGSVSGADIVNVTITGSDGYDLMGEREEA